MSRHYLHHNGLKPSRWHRLWCLECRKNRPTDATLSLGMECLKAESFPEAGLARTLSALNLPMSLPQRRRRARISGRRMLLSATTVTLFLTMGGYSWLRYIDTPANISVPTPFMPRQNAYHTFRSAAAAVVDEGVLGSIVSRGINLPKAKREASPQTASLLGDKDMIVQRNGKALQLVRQGLTLPYQEPPPRSRDTLFPHYAQFRSLARLLAFEAQVKAVKRDWGGSMNSSLDAMQLGMKFPHGGVMIGKLSGIACESIGRQTAWDAIPHLTAQQAREAAQRLETIRRERDPFSVTLQEEERWGLTILQNETLAPGWRWNFYSTVSNSEYTSRNEASVQHILTYLYLLRYTNREIVEHYKNYMDRAVEQATIAARVPVAQTIEIEAPRDPICDIMLPVFADAGFRDLLSELQNTFLRVALALQTYRLEKGQYPDSLNQLVPLYMKDGPLDPFWPNHALSYRRAEQTYELYSLGPDGRDNGGVPISRSTNNPSEMNYNVSRDSWGDIVAGKNRQ